VNLKSVPYVVVTDTKSNQSFPIVRIEWFYEGSKEGEPAKWFPYGHEMSKKLEESFNKGENFLLVTQSPRREVTFF